MKGWSLSRRRVIGSLDEWDLKPLLILLIYLSARLQAGKQVTRRGSGVIERYKLWKMEGTYDKNVVLPHSASPKSKIVTPGASAIPKPCFAPQKKV